VQRGGKDKKCFGLRKNILEKVKRYGIVNQEKMM